ncbi:MAG: hypothetical protein KKD73_01225 [Proteobacteria bacterium]|nr:hypothetical protein [Pseudomonadota bacterium]MBU1641119.1 hypothetical protein [Pseudomonadota bacterium]
MALAILSDDGYSDQHHNFRADLGSNLFYSYAIGDKEQTVKREGRRVLSPPLHKSELFGPLPQGADGRLRIKVLAQLFDNKNRFIQLYSFRTRDLAGPAFSDIISVLPAPDSGHAFSLGRGEVPVMQDYDEYVDNSPFSYKAAPIAESMFLGAISGIISKVLPIAEKILPSLLGGGKGGGGKAEEGAGAGAGAGAGGGEMIKMIMELLKQFTAAKATSQGVFYSDKRVAAEAASVQRQYAEAQIAPALLAALPALMPLLKNVLSPETIKGVVDSVSPTKLAGIAVDGLKDAFKTIEKLDQAELDFLGKINPGVDDPALDKLLMSMGLAVQAEQNDISYKRINSVTLDFEGVKTINVHGRSRIAYKHGKDLTFPLKLNTPKTIKRATLHLLVKEPESLKTLAEVNGAVKDLSGGLLPATAKISAAKLADLKPGEEYLVKAVLVWKNKGGEARGTSKSQLITLVGDTIFDRVEDSVGTVIVADKNKYPAFSHKVWQSSFSKDLRRITFQCRYTYALATSSGNNARNPTVTRIEEKQLRHDIGKLKSGMELSPDALNRLLPQISSHPSLEPMDLAALRNDDFHARYNVAGRTSMELGAMPGDSAALFVYPEFNLHRVVLQKAKEVDEATGQVLATEEKSVIFPLVAAIHLAAAVTGESVSGSQNPNEPDVIDGMKIKNRKRVPVFPVQLVKVNPDHDKTMMD